MGTKRKLIATLAATAAVMGMATPAFADVAYVSGGTWNYGTGGGRVWSDYYHGRNCHRSSVQGQYYVSSGNVRAGLWSRASAPDRLFAVDHSYYSSNC